MKQRVDLQNSSSMAEAISLATKFESFYLGEGQSPVAGRGESRPSKGRSAPVLAEEQPADKTGKRTNEKLVSLRKQIETKTEKDSRSISNLEQKISKLTEQVESLTKIGFSKTGSQS